MVVPFYVLENIVRDVARIAAGLSVADEVARQVSSLYLIAPPNDFAVRTGKQDNVSIKPILYLPEVEKTTREAGVDD